MQLKLSLKNVPNLNLLEQTIASLIQLPPHVSAITNQLEPNLITRVSTVWQWSKLSRLHILVPVVYHY